MQQNQTSKSQKLDPQQAIGFPLSKTINMCSDRDAIIYALGIGFSTDPLKDEDLQYTYERHDNYQIFPTYSASLHRCDLFEALIACPGVPNFNPMMLLHGEQNTTIYKQLVPNTTYVSKGKLVDVADKIKGALIVVRIDTFELDSEQKETLAISNTNSFFIRGLGGFGYKGLNNQIQQIIPSPSRNPDKVLQEKTTQNLALIFRLSGDWNPLHVDQNMSALGGFDRPILHGLSTYGITNRLVVQTYCKSDATKLKQIAARFTSHVFPGETLIVSLWKDGNRIQFSVKTLERGIEVLIGQTDILEDPKL